MDDWSRLPTDSVSLPRPGGSGQVSLAGKGFFWLQMSHCASPCACRPLTCTEGPRSTFRKAQLPCATSSGARCLLGEGWGGRCIFILMFFQCQGHERALKFKSEEKTHFSRRKSRGSSTLLGCKQLPTLSLDPLQVPLPSSSGLSAPEAPACTQKQTGCRFCIH